MSLSFMSFLAALHRLYILSVHRWAFFFFFQGSTTPKCWPFIGFFFTQTVLSSDDRNLSSTYTVSFTTFSSNLMTFSNKLPRLVNVQCSVCLVIQEFKMSSHYLYPLYPCSLCTKSNITWTLWIQCIYLIPAHMETGFIGTFRQELICAHKI